MLSILILMSFGIYFIKQRKTAAVLGYILIGQSINLFLLYMNIGANLLEQSLLLTSIVISLGMIALLIKK